MTLTIQKAEYYTRLQFQKSRSGRGGSNVPKILHSFRDKMAAAIFSKFAGYWRFECWTTKSVTLVGQGKEKITIAEYFWNVEPGTDGRTHASSPIYVQRLLCRCQCAQQFKPLFGHIHFKALLPKPTLFAFTQPATKSVGFLVKCNGPVTFQDSMKNSMSNLRRACLW